MSDADLRQIRRRYRQLRSLSPADNLPGAVLATFAAQDARKFVYDLIAMHATPVHRWEEDGARWEQFPVVDREPVKRSRVRHDHRLPGARVVPHSHEVGGAA